MVGVVVQPALQSDSGGWHATACTLAPVWRGGACAPPPPTRSFCNACTHREHFPAEYKASTANVVRSALWRSHASQLAHCGRPGSPLPLRLSPRWGKTVAVQRLATAATTAASAAAATVAAAGGSPRSPAASARTAAPRLSENAVALAGSWSGESSVGCRQWHTDSRRQGRRRCW